MSKITSKTTRSSFREFMDEAKKSPDKRLPFTHASLVAIQENLAESIRGIVAPFSGSIDERQEFSNQVSSLIQDETFLNEFSDQSGEPLKDESEDEFVERSSNTLRKMLYEKFDVQ
jgi:hypothetical protein